MRYTDLDFHPEGKSLQHLLVARVASTPDRIAAKYWTAGKLESDTWSQLALRVRCITSRLKPLSLVPRSVVGIFMPTSYSWMLADLACIQNGWVSAAYHTAWLSDELRHAIMLSQPQIILCSSELRKTAITAMKAAGCPLPLVVLDDVLSLSVALEGEEPVPSASIASDSTLSDTPATIVFTSGTAADSKAVELSHGALLGSAWHAYEHLGYDGRGKHTLHWLPLSHMFGRIGLYIDLIAGSVPHFSRGVERLADDLTVARPHVLFAVPRVLTRLKQRIEERANAKSISSRLVFLFFKSVGGAAARLPISVRLKAQAFLRKSLLSAVHRPLGGNLNVVIVGGAPVDPQEKRYFESLGLAVREGFGMTETAGVASVQPLREKTSGAGSFLPCIEACLGPQGELLLRGTTMLSRYRNAEAYDLEGWFHTGDIASVGADGSLTITGRLKEIIIPETGENVSPARLESLICGHPWIEDACIVGDRRPCLVAIISLSESGREAKATQGVVALEQAFYSHFEAINVSLPKYERIRAHVVAYQAFSVESGELSVTQKKKRQVIVSRYASEIEACYSRLQSVHEKANPRLANASAPSTQSTGV